MSDKYSDESETSDSELYSKSEVLFFGQFNPWTVPNCVAIFLIQLPMGSWGKNIQGQVLKEG